MSTGMQGCLAELVLIMKMSSVITKQIKLNAITYFKWKRSQTLRKLSVRLWDFWIPRALPSIWATTCQKTCWNLWRHLNRAVPSGKEINTQNRFLCVYRSACNTQRYAMTAVVGCGGWLLFQPPWHGQSLSALTDSMFPDWEGLSQPFSHCDHPTSPSPFSAAGSTTLFLHCLQPSSSSHLLPEVCRNCIIRCW